MPNAKLTIALIFSIVLAVITAMFILGRICVRRGWQIAKLIRSQTIVLLIAYVLLLFVLTVVGRDKRDDDIVCFVLFGDLYFIISNGHPWYFDNIILLNLFNVVLFIPCGLLSGSLIQPKRRWITLIICVAVSALIEVVQLFTKRGVFDVNDIMYNTVGSLIGWGLYNISCKFTRNNNQVLSK